jgi:hypothetical protein
MEGKNMITRRYWAVALLALGFAICPRPSAAEELPVAAGAAKEAAAPDAVVATVPVGPLTDALRSPATGAVCSDGACGAACGACAPSCCQHWRGSLEVSSVFMQRVRPNNVPIFNSPAGATLLNARDFDFDWEAGWDAKLILNGRCRRGAEVRFFYLNEPNADVNFAVPPGNSSVQTTPTTNFGGPATATFDYKTQLWSVEASARQTMENDIVTFLAGVRYIHVHDRLNGNFDFGGSESETWNVRNNLYGFQVGADGLLLSRSKLRLDGFVRAGVYFNDATSSFLRLPAPAFAHDSSNNIAFGGEAGVFGTYQVTKNIAIRGGYQFLWLSGVALASEQVSTTGNFNGGFGERETTINRGDLFYHGAKLGVEFRW